MTNDKLICKHARWTLILQEYDFMIIHKPSLKHANADVRSRHPPPSTVDNGDRRDHNDGKGDRPDALAGGYAKLWHEYSAPSVVIAREARGRKGRATNRGAQLRGPPHVWTNHLCMKRLVGGDMP